MDYSAVPAVLFTYPQYAMVGYTEDALKREGIPYKKSFGENLSWPTYRRIGMSNAAYKILVGKSGEFLGAHILSDNASGIINTIRLAMLNRICVGHPVPSKHHVAIPFAGERHAVHAETADMKAEIKRKKRGVIRSCLMKNMAWSLPLMSSQRIKGIGIRATDASCPAI